MKTAWGNSIPVPWGEEHYGGSVQREADSISQLTWEDKKNTMPYSEGMVF